MNVQGAGGLPDYICRIAKAIKRTGKSTSQAISIAVSRVKLWASGKGVNKDTQAKAAEAVAAWEALRAKSHAKTAAKGAGKTAKMSAARNGEILCLANTSFNTDLVRKAWNASADQWEQGNGGLDSAVPGDDDTDSPAPRLRAYSYIKELWTDFIIVESVDGDLYRVDYTVGDPDNDGDIDVSFDDPVPVKVEYVTMSATDMVGSEISDTALLRMIELTPACQFSAVEQLLMSAGPAQPKSALDTILTLTAGKPATKKFNTAISDIAGG